MKKILTVLAAILAFTVFFAACSKEPEPEPESSSEPEPVSVVEEVVSSEPEEPVEEEPVKLKALVIYFSRPGGNYKVGDITEGNTYKVAKEIALQTDAEMFEIGAAALDAIIIVEFRDERESDEDSFGHAFVREQVAQVVVYQFLLSSGIIVIDRRVGVFDIDNPLRNKGDEPVEMLLVHMKACFDVEVPSLVHHLCEFLDEGASYTWLPSSESHSPS